MTCPTCGKPRERPHYHGDEDHSLALRYGRFKAEQERDWIRELVARTHADLDREIEAEDRAIFEIG
jgi:hypothetical protein